MGNYNCQECVNKEVNFLNELLLDNKIFANDSISHDNSIPSHSSKIKHIKANKEKIKKALENTNLSEEQKNYFKKIINENSNDNLERELDNAIKLRIVQKNITENNKNDSNEKEKSSKEQKKLIEYQQEKIFKQQKIIEEYQRKQLILEQQQNLLKEDEEKLKMKIQQKKAQMQEEEGNKISREQSQNLEGIKIQNLEPLIIGNINEEIGDNNQQIIIKQEEESEKNEKIENSFGNKDISRKNIQNINSLQNIGQELHQIQIEENELINLKGKDQEDEPEDGEKNDKRKSQKQQEKIIKNFQQKNENINMNINLDNSSHPKGQIPQETFTERTGLNNILAQLPQTQRFKIEAYKPIESGQKRGNENYINNGEINDNNIYRDNENQVEDNEYKNNIYARMKEKPNTPKDSRKQNLKMSLRPRKREKDINNMSDYTNYIQDKKNFQERSPKDNRKSNRTDYKKQNDYYIEKSNKKIDGPLDSKRKDSMESNNQNQNSLNKKEISTQKQKMPVNRKEEIQAYSNQQMNINNQNINVNPISTAISNAVLNENNDIKQKNNINPPNSQNQQKYFFVKKEIFSPSEQEYIIKQEQKFSPNNKIIINQIPQYNIPNQNQMNNNNDLNNNMQNLENYDFEVRMINNENQNNIDGNPEEMGDCTNQSLDINNNLNQSEPLIAPQDYDDQQTSQKDFDFTISERDNPLLISDDKGNMNYLERHYKAYQDRMRQNDDN